MFSAISKYLTINNFLNLNPSGFMPDDSFVRQVVSIIPEIYAFFDTNPSLEVSGVSLNISKGFECAYGI